MTPEQYKAVKPSFYKALYENLVVPLDGGKTATVVINQYRLAHYNVNEKVRDAFLSKLHDNKGDLNLSVYSAGQIVDEVKRSDAAPVDKSVSTKLALLARYAFSGKGAPEHVQLVLQLVDRWKLAPKGLQAYADDALGLDCNGFVGNYIWHVKREKPWDDQGLNASEGPDSTISQYLAGKNVITKWEDMRLGSSYVLGEVNPMSGQVIDGGSAGKEGHIAITEPSSFRAAVGKVAAGIFVVEATGGHKPGLSASWYSLTQMNKKFKTVFDINREDMIAGHQQRSFKIVEFR